MHYHDYEAPSHVWGDNPRGTSLWLRTRQKLDASSAHAAVLSEKKQTRQMDDDRHSDVHQAFQQHQRRDFEARTAAETPYPESSARSDETLGTGGTATESCIGTASSSPYINYHARPSTMLSSASDLVGQPGDELPSGDDLSLARPDFTEQTSLALAAAAPRSASLPSLHSLSSYHDSGVANSYHSQDAESSTEAVQLAIPRLRSSPASLERVPSSLASPPDAPLAIPPCENCSSESPTQGSVAPSQGSGSAEGEIGGEPPMPTNSVEQQQELYVEARKLQGELCRYIDDEELVYVEKFTCPACRCLLRQAVQTECGHLYCLLCHEQLLT